MKIWIRIIVVVFVLVGGTASFGYWSINQLDKTLDNMSAVYLANVPLINSLKQKTDLASSSPDVSGLLATSTVMDKQKIDFASSSPDVSGLLATSTNVTELNFIFPQKKGGVYIGCTYPISWQSSTTIDSLEIVIVDASIREAIRPIISGLKQDNIINKDSQNIDWKVGSVKPGTYYFKISKVNAIDKIIRSKPFTINKMPAGINVDEKENLCEESGALF